MPNDEQSGDHHLTPAPAVIRLQPGTPRIGFRHYMAAQHLWTARREAWLCRAREDRLLGVAEMDQLHRSHGTTAVLSAVVFLEAFINATWQDAAHHAKLRDSPFTDGIAADTLETMRRRWTGEAGGKPVERFPILDKFQEALECVGGRERRMDAGDVPFQHADLLVDLRDALVHYKPNWHYTDQDHLLVESLKRVIRAEQANRQPVGEPWFPNKALGAGCADWACTTSITLTRAWHERIGLSGDFDEMYLTSLPPVEVDEG